MKARTIAILVFSCSLTACAATATAIDPPPVPSEPSPDVLARAHQKLPNIKKVGQYPYPPMALRQNLSGRVLLEFQVDQAGKAVGGKILSSEAAPILQAQALKMLAAVEFQPPVDAVDTRPILGTVQFCISACATPPYPGTDFLRLTGALLPPGQGRPQ